MATVQISGAPENLDMQTFRSISDDYGGLVRSARFAAVIRPQGQFIVGLSPIISDLPYLCEVSEIPGRGFMNIDLRYYGPNFKLPFQSQYEDINMTFLCRANSLERQFFDDWMTVINPINTWDFNYRDDYEAEIDIFQFGEVGEDSQSTGPTAQYKITMRNAYPVLVNPQPVTWGDDQFQRVVVNFTYTSWYRRGIDPVARGMDTNSYSFNLVEGRTNNRG
jgi:hypothetical protein